MTKLRILDLFSGIGGFSLGLERTGGFETVAFCEIEPFPRRVLAKHWPGVPIYEDVTKLTGDILARDGIAVDVITGGFPCQDISTAGKQAGMSEGTRSGLWSEIVRLIGELSPRYVIVENVANLLSGPSEKRGGWFGRILGDLAECGYDAEWENIPASALGAPHRRERVWIVAYTNGGDGESSESQRPRIRAATSGQRADIDACRSSFGPGTMADTRGRRRGEPCSGKVEQSGRAETIGTGQAMANAYGINAQGQQPRRTHTQERTGPLTRPLGSLLAELGGVWVTEPDVGRVAPRLPDGAHRLAGLGNAVVPQIPELIGRAILAAEATA